VNGVRFGLQVRALRRRLGWRQQDLATRAAVSRGLVSRAERGLLGGVTLGHLEQLSQALGTRLDVGLRWHGEALDRLLDSEHAAIVDAIVRLLAADDWRSDVEVTFNVRGERGSIDILAVHPATGSALVVEVKSVVPDVQAMLASLDRKARVAPQLGRWGLRQRASRLLVLADTRTSRRRIEQHADLFAASLPARTVACRQWLRSPSGELRGLMFLPLDRVSSARHRVPETRRAMPSVRSGTSSQRLCHLLNWRDVWQHAADEGTHADQTTEIERQAREPQARPARPQSAPRPRTARVAAQRTRRGRAGRTAPPGLD
jgi:transcriptional regulator with XRE-family HTH domain